MKEKQIEKLPSILVQEFCDWLEGRVYWVPNTEEGMKEIQETWLWTCVFNMN